MKLKERKAMRDFLGFEIEVGDVILYGNNAGFITLAVVTEMKEGSLHVIQRGYRDSKVERELLVPSNVYVITGDVNGMEQNEDFEFAASPQALEFVIQEHLRIEGLK